MKRRDFLKTFGMGLLGTAGNIRLLRYFQSKDVGKIFPAAVITREMARRDVAAASAAAARLQIAEFDWYIDSVDGSDANDGASISTPVKTFAMLAKKPIAAGQKVGIRSGSVFRETLLPPSSGSDGSPITYKSYGDGALPRVLGSNALSDWTQTGIAAAAADIISEGFETSKPSQNGYDAGSWTERISAGCKVDPDNADIAAPDRSAQVLKIEKVSPNYSAETEKNLGAEKAVSYTSLYIYIAAEGLSSGDSINLLQERAASTADVMGVSLNKSGTQLRFALTVYNNGAINYSYYNIRPGQWYLVSLKYDYTHRTYEKWVDGVQIGSGSLTGALRTGIQILTLGDSSHSKTVTVYFDAFNISSTNYPTAGVALPVNCYKASFNRRPAELYFEQLSGKTRRGLVQSTMAACSAEYQWYYHMNGYVVLYAPSDPGTRYVAVEGGVRTNCIAHNNQTYITIDGLEVAYSVQDTISVASNWNVQYCQSHHASKATIRAGSNWGGIYGGNVSNCVVRFCTIHDHACKGVQFAAENGASISGNLIEHNVFYDNGDFSIDCQVFSNGNANAGLIIQYNEFFTTTDWNTADSSGANGIFTCGRPGYPMVGTVVRYNLFHDLAGNGVQVGPNLNGMLIYNNTFARTLSGYTGNSSAIYCSPNAESCSIKNNIGYGFTYQMYIPDSSRVTEADYNCWYTPGSGYYVLADWITYRAANFAAYRAATGWDIHGVWADPMMVSASDLRLQSGSPCINAGINLGIMFDFAGVKNGDTPEIGAYEKPELPKEILLSNLRQIYNGSPRPVSVSTTPPGLPVSLLYRGISDTTYDPSYQPPTDAGSYRVDVVVNDQGYFGSTTDTLIIEKASAAVTLNNLVQGFNGNPKPVTAATNPPGLNVLFTYTGILSGTYGPSSQAPTQPGVYRVDASIDSLNYQGSASGTLTIGKSVFLPLITH